jgi:hypothetical protein
VVAASGSTSIGAGLQLARTALEANVRADEEPFERPAILVLSDGMENTAPWIADQLGALQARGVPVYSIGFGEDYQIDAQKLADLSVATGGVYRHTSDPGDLTKFFLEVMVDHFADTSMLLDPKGTVSAGAPQSHAFAVAAVDETIVLVAAWRDAAVRLDLQVNASGTTISQAILAAGASVVDRGMAYKVMVVPVCRGGVVTNCAQPGSWQATVTAPPGVAQQPYSLTVLTRSDSRLTFRLPRLAFAGEPLPIEVRLFHGGKPVPNARITLKVSVPAENVFHRVAAGTVAAGALSKLRATDGARSLQERKGMLVYGGAAVPRKTHELKTEVSASGAGATYRTMLPDTRHPGSYDVTVRAEWRDAGGRAVMREATASAFVRAKVSPKSKVAVRTAGRIKEGGVRTVELDFTPLDSGGQMLGLGLADRIQALAGTGKLEHFTDLGNGTYRLSTEVPADWRSIPLSMDGTAWAVAIPQSK